MTHGFPWSSLSHQRRESGEFDDLKKPGWLPTAIVVNILKRDDLRDGEAVHANDVIDVKARSGRSSELILPSGFQDDIWEPRGIAPIEVIDGQHRLWAFDTDDGEYELPVVAFQGLDISWQAYLFYSINIKPKRINTSLAFDLYPLLRTEDWLEKFEGHSIYRETRAQEITEALWSYPESPWHDRIDMLGEHGRKAVTQAAWIRSLLATLIKSSGGRGVKIGGLFGAPVGEHQLALGWSRAQQSAFVILLWQELAMAVRKSTAAWAEDLRELDDDMLPEGADPAFEGRYSLLNSDQGVRGVLAIANDLCFLAIDDLRLEDLQTDAVEEGTAEQAISNALQALRRAAAGKFLRRLSANVVTYDWRVSAAPSLSASERSEKARFRGGTGYRELRADLLNHVAKGKGDVARFAAEVISSLGF